MILRFFIFFCLTFLITSCSKEWSVNEQKSYLDDCLQFSQDQAEICECGLQKAMNEFNSLKEAQTEIQNMSEREVEDFFAECF